MIKEESGSHGPLFSLGVDPNSSHQPQEPGGELAQHA
tara:strand:+ start:8966 stop:9076 length:111 start_codon:yes stop_codon:yes gene_type:complete